MRAAVFALLSIVCAGPALAGQPVRGATVTVHAGVGGGAARFAWPMRVARQHPQFDRFVRKDGAMAQSVAADIRKPPVRRGAC